jgi:uncharacterized protein (TIGR02118 family)
MYKVIWLFKFKEGWDKDEAQRHWKDVHAPIFLRVPGVERYVQNLWVSPIDSGTGMDTGSPFDGHTEAWFTDKAAYDAAITSTQYDELTADGSQLFEYSTLQGGEVQERVIR